MCLQIDVGYNNIDEAASLLLIAAMKGKSMESIGMAGCELGVEGAKATAELVSVMASLTRVDVRFNDLAGDSASQLSEVVLGNENIEVFNEVPIKQMRTDSLTELDLEGKYIGVEGCMVVAGLLPAMASLTSVWSPAHPTRVRTCSASALSQSTPAAYVCVYACLPCAAQSV